MYSQRWKIWRLALFTLIGLGVLSMLADRPGSILFPLLVVGIIYFLYKHPPRWLMRFVHPSAKRVKTKGPRSSKRKRETKGRPHLRVIEGNAPKKPVGESTKTKMH